MNQAEPYLLIPPEFYFQLQYLAAFTPDAEKQIQAGKHPVGLTEFVPIRFTSAPQGSPAPQIHLGWNNHGFILQMRYGRPDWRAPVSIAKEMLRGDVLRIFIDSRDIKTNHRLNRFCTEFFVEKLAETDSQLSVFRAESQKSEQQLTEQQAAQLLTHTSEETALSLFLHKEVITGFDPENVPSIGFYFAFGGSNPVHHFGGLDDRFPVRSDPSLWPSVRLAR